MSDEIQMKARVSEIAAIFNRNDREAAILSAILSERIRAQSEERERCARIAAEHPSNDPLEIAAAIRNVR